MFSLESFSLCDMFIYAPVFGLNSVYALFMFSVKNCKSLIIEVFRKFDFFFFDTLKIAPFWYN